jgi:pimeloyl-ACP methyl ester carboxylesterase
MDCRTSSGGRLNASISAVTRRIAKWKRGKLSRLTLHYPSLLRFLPTPRPLTIRRQLYSGSESQRDLLVLLPGIEDCAADFEEWGFADLVRQHRWAVDLLMVDAHYGYYADRSILDQLHQDVFIPAKSMSYRHIWLAGISLGGLGALLYASRFGGDVTGVVALAPFLGTETVVSEITAAGGLARWTATMTTPSDEIRSLWAWLETERHTPTFPQLYLGFGQADMFIGAHRILATRLPDTHVITAPGGHRWPVWQQLWDEFLRRHMQRR